VTFSNSIKFAVVVIILTLSAAALAQSGRDYVYVVGSSTVYPFATVVAERFGRGSEFKTPKIESTGSGGGLKLFCDGVGILVVDESRRGADSPAHGTQVVIE
jgi:phosphate transport system substrate-binding protein